MAKWEGLTKVCEELFELGVELMKLSTYPKGKHPRRKRSLVVTTQEEAADVLAALNYFIDRNKLDRTKIDRRAAYKYRKWVKRHGSTGTSYGKKNDPKVIKKAVRKAVKKSVAKRAPKVETPVLNASTIDQTSQNDLKTT